MSVRAVGGFHSNLRSQSSVQLLGFIESCIQPSAAETSDDGELRVKGYQTLLQTSTAVLSCIQVYFDAFVGYGR